MPEHGKPGRINVLASFINELREEIAKSRELLKEPILDTFLGRKTQEPFPKEGDGEARRLVA